MKPIHVGIGAALLLAAAIGVGQALKSPRDPGTPRAIERPDPSGMVAHKPIYLRSAAFPVGRTSATRCEPDAVTVLAVFDVIAPPRPSITLDAPWTPEALLVKPSHTEPTGDSHPDPEVVTTADLQAARPIVLSVSAGETLFELGPHPGTDRCLYELPDARLISAPCLLPPSDEAEPRTRSHVRCDGPDGPQEGWTSDLTRG